MSVEMPLHPGPAAHIATNHKNLLIPINSTEFKSESCPTITTDKSDQLSS